ncbi:MAG: amidase [Hyphomicrobiales bacterium]|jgi:amidase|nr:amidase [Hyphomicrobiales bacterium]
MDQLHYKSALELAGLIRRKKIGCLELLDHFLARVEKYNPKLNAIIWMNKDKARKRAKAADAALRKGKPFGPLHGVPMTIKESYQVAGSPTTWGAPSMKDNVTEETAISAQRMIDAGVTLFGKTNVPLMLADWQSYNAVYGVTRNPWDTDRTPGGSSGGSAAALASGMTAIDAGSDIGSSIRNPAHYCGVFGHKPTWGLITYRGHALPNSVAPPDISVVGPLARSAADLAVALDVMAGPDPDDGGYLKVALAKCEKTSLRQFRIAVKLTDPASDVDTEYADQLQALVDKLAKAGCKIKEAAPDVDTARLHDMYIRLLRAATSARMPESDIKDWQRELASEPNEYLAQSVDGVTMTHRRWLQLNNERHQMRLRFNAFFKDYDVLLCPVAASAAFPHDHKHEGKRWRRRITVNNKRVSPTDQLFWAGYSGLVYLPSTVGPAGITPSGLPTGYQAIAAQGKDKTSIAFARLVEKAVGGFEPPPGYD